MNAVDTNVLIYVQDSREPDKQSTAAALISSLSDGVLLWQVACEYIAASRKLAPLGYDRHQAWIDLQGFRSVWAFSPPTWAVLERADDLMSRFSLSFWDAAVVSAAIEAGAETLYSEDFSAYSQIDGLKLVDPFAST